MGGGGNGAFAWLTKPGGAKGGAPRPGAACKLGWLNAGRGGADPPAPSGLNGARPGGVRDMTAK